jgi:hypothetical protein
MIRMWGPDICLQREKNEAFVFNLSEVVRLEATQSQ